MARTMNMISVQTTGTATTPCLSSRKRVTATATIRSAVSTNATLPVGRAEEMPDIGSSEWCTSASSNDSGMKMANVTAVEEMINLITAQRAFEFNSKAVQASDQMLREIAQLR